MNWRLESGEYNSVIKRVVTCCDIVCHLTALTTGEAGGRREVLVGSPLDCDWEEER